MSEIRIPGFEILERVGAGGMGSVWKARQVSLDRIVAIKILYTSMTQDPADVERFRAEAQTAAKLKHPGIIQVYDAGFEDGLYFFVMEYVDGYSVGDWMRRKGVLGERDALIVAESVAQALSYAWDKAGIIHCDVKPDNLMIDADGSVKVADLGLARMLDSVRGEAGSEDVLGTPAYMSPEQTQGLARLDFRADVYSLGATLYHLLTGRMLFQGFPIDQTMEMQVTHADADPLELNPKLSPAVCWLLETMLAKDPEHRHPDWAAAIVDLAMVRERGQMPFRLLPTEGLSTIRRSPRRRSGEAAAVTESLPEGRAIRQGLGRASKLWIVAGVTVLAIVAGAWFLLGGAAPGGGGDAKGGEPSAKVQPLGPVAAAEPAAPVPAAPSGVALPVSVAGKEVLDENKFSLALAWEQANPGQYDEAIRRYVQIRQESQDPHFVTLAREKIRTLTESRDREAQAVLDSLAATADKMGAENRWQEAATVYEGYTGPLARETWEVRIERANEFKRKGEEVAREKESLESEAQKAASAAMDRVISALVSAGIPEARQSLERVANDPLVASRVGNLKELQGILSDAEDVEDGLIQSYRKDIGRNVVLDLMGGKTISGTIEAVANRQVVVRAAGGKRETIGLEGLGYRERLARLGSQQGPAVSLVKGLMAYKAKAFPYAQKYFSETPPALAFPLAALLCDVTAEDRNTAAEQALGRILAAAGVTVGEFDPDAWTAAVQGSRLSAEDAIRVRKALEKYFAKHGQTDFIRKAQPVLQALREAATPQS